MYIEPFVVCWLQEKKFMVLKILLLTFLNLAWARGTLGLRHVISNVQSVCDESF